MKHTLNDMLHNPMDHLGKWICLLFVWVFLAAMLLASFTIVKTAQAHTPREIKLPSYQKPTIPQCDKELWDRIREGCDV